MNETTKTAELSVADRICQLVAEDVVQLPPLPEVTLRIQQLIAADRADATQISDLMSNEPALAVSLLRVANSAAFGGLQPVTQLSQAVARVGLKQVGAIVTALAVKGHFETDDKDKQSLLRALWDHSVGSAFAARQIAESLGHDGTEAFLAGLLHDCGKLMVLRAVDHLGTQGVESLTPPVVEELMEVLHTKLGFDTLTRWNLAESIARVVLRHEDPADHGDDALLSTVQAADLICKKLGFHAHPEPDLRLLDEPAIEQLGLGDVALASLMIDIEDQLADVRRLFQ